MTTPAAPDRTNQAPAEFFDDLVPRLRERACDYRAKVDVIDGEILDIFENELNRTVTDLIVACDAHDEAVVRRHGHSLEGMGGTMGFPELSVVGAELSQTARLGEWPRCSELARRLEQWSRRLKANGSPTQHG